jgi:hypothetical protein
MFGFFENRVGKDFNWRDRFIFLGTVLTEKLLWLFVDSAAQEVGNDVFFVVGV